MADFNKAFAYLLIDEGRYANNVNDPGGETYRGIARTRWPDWHGWAVVDSFRGDPAFPRVLDAEEHLQDLVVAFYRQNFWKFDGLASQDVANQLFDFAVNDGLVQGIKLLQKAARYVSGSSLNVDGVYGPATDAAVNASDPAKLLSELKAQAVLFYISLSKPTFLLGWIRRACRVTLCG